jgi:ComF family protein
LRRVRSAVWLDDLARRAVHGLKYGGWWRIAEQLAGAMAGLLPAGPALLVPIPLSPRRLRRRGYNQAERVAAALSRRAGLPLARDRLRRVRDTPTQTALPPEARQANVAEAFHAAGVAGARVVLVDDVFTTGATLAEAARSLAQAGAKAVEAVTFARARPPMG